MTLLWCMYMLTWEWVTFALEFAATAWWVRLSPAKWAMAVAGVNLATHPALMFVVMTFGCERGFILCCEAVVVLVEWGILVGVFGRSLWRRMLAAAVVANTISYLTGEVLSAAVTSCLKMRLL